LVFAESPVRATLWLVTLLEPVAVEPYDVVVPYSTTEVLASLVVHVTVAPLVVMDAAVIPEMVGGVVSAVPVLVALTLKLPLPL
jgi:hypothetical protein